MHARPLLMSLSISAALGLAACGGSSAGSADPLLGTWELNVAKSSYVPAPGPKAQTVVISGTDQARKLVVDITPDAGAPMHWEVAGAANQDLPVVGVNPNADTYTFRRVNQTTTEARYKKGGKPTITQTAVVSADGKVLTVTGRGINAAGNTVNTTAVYDRK